MERRETLNAGFVEASTLNFPFYIDFVAIA